MTTIATTLNTTSTLRAAIATVVITASVVGWSLPAFAAPVREARSPSPAISLYASPLDALGGQTLAQYLADHQAGNTRLR